MIELGETVALIAFTAARGCMAEATTNDTQKCHLLELPAELRNRIYEYAVILDEPVFAHLGDPDSRAPYVEPALTRTNHQLRTESLPIYYGQSIFRVSVDMFDHKKALRSWIVRIGDKAARIRDMELELCCDHGTILSLETISRDSVSATCSSWCDIMASRAPCQGWSRSFAGFQFVKDCWWREHCGPRALKTLDAMVLVGVAKVLDAEEFGEFVSNLRHYGLPKFLGFHVLNAGRLGPAA